MPEGVPFSRRRRRLLEILAGMLFSSALMTMGRAESASDRPDKASDFKHLQELRKISEKAFSALYQGHETGSPDEVYGRSYDYGVAFRKFEQKYGVGSDYFKDRGKELKNHFHDWLMHNGQATQAQKLQMLDKLIGDLKREFYGPTTKRSEDHAIGTYLRGFFCGYYGDLCPPVS